MLVYSLATISYVEIYNICNIVNCFYSDNLNLYVIMFYHILNLL